MFFLKLVLKNSLDPEPGSENGDKQLRSVSVINLTADFEFRETPIKSLSS